MTIAESIQSGQDAVSGAGMKASDYLDRLTGRYKVKPKTMDGIGGFVFDYEAETSVTLQSEITDHYAEDGTVLNDHIVTKPVRVTLRGFVGELVYRRKSGVAGVLSTIASKLTTVDAYLGKYTPQAIGKIQGVLANAQTLTTKINNYADRAKNIVGMFQKGAPGKTKQEQAFHKLRSLQTAGTMFTVESGVNKEQSPIISAVTPFVFLDNMVIETVVFSQGEDTKFVSDITVTLKRRRPSIRKKRRAERRHSGAHWPPKVKRMGRRCHLRVA
jgi:hypothetical protein